MDALKIVADMDHYFYATAGATVDPFYCKKNTEKFLCVSRDNRVPTWESFSLIIFQQLQMFSISCLEMELAMQDSRMSHSFDLIS